MRGVMSGDSSSSNDEAETGANKPEGGAGERKDGGGKRKRQIVAGAAIGVGSAAIVAAMLYANRGRKGGGKSGGGDKDGGEG
jgi:hypothetical protein